LTLLPGALRLRFGVVSTVGNYREQNEDNFYVPGRTLGGVGNRPDDVSTMIEAPSEVGVPNGPSTPEGAAEVPSVLSSQEQPALFLVADGMGGQQAGEQASLMAVEIIPKEVAKRLVGGENDLKLTQTVIRDAVAEANQEILGSSGTVTEFS